MKLREIYAAFIAKGIEQDPRGKALVHRELRRVKDAFEKLSEEERKDFDQERLENPYSDTRILHGDPALPVKSALVGIDIDVGEVLLADRLREKGTPVDVIVSHHPGGRALAGLYQVMAMQTDITHLFGVPVTIAEHLMETRIAEVERKLLPANHTKTVDAARLLDIPFFCVHTPADNHVASYLQRLFDKKKPDTLAAILKLLKEIPEYQIASRNSTGPKIVHGNPDSRAGKVFVDMTGGTEGSSEIFKSLAQAGVGTVVGMHLSEDHLKRARQEHMNVIIAGHISSDSLGLNLLFDTLGKKHALDIIGCSGFTRIRRDL